MTFLFNLVILAALAYGFFRFLKYAKTAGQRYRSKFDITCPRCNTLNVVPAGECRNCHGTTTEIQRGTETPLQVYCHECFAVVPFFAECVKPGCGVDFASIILRKKIPESTVKNYMRR